RHVLGDLDHRGGVVERAARLRREADVGAREHAAHAYVVLPAGEIHGAVQSELLSEPAQLRERVAVPDEDRAPVVALLAEGGERAQRVVEDERRPAPLERPRSEQEEVGRVARVHDVEAALPREPPDEPPGVPERRGVLARVPDWAAGGRMRRIPVDLDAVAPLERLAVAV